MLDGLHSLSVVGEQIQVGTDVNLISYNDTVIQRKLVAVENGVYFVCKSDEFENAEREGRDPVCIGFRREYVLGVGNEG
jgi:hypothetical protein